MLSLWVLLWLLSQPTLTGIRILRILSCGFGSLGQGLCLLAFLSCNIFLQPSHCGIFSLVLHPHGSSWKLELMLSKPIFPAVELCCCLSCSQIMSGVCTEPQKLNLESFLQQIPGSDTRNNPTWDISRLCMYPICTAKGNPTSSHPSSWWVENRFQADWIFSLPFQRATVY